MYKSFIKYTAICLIVFASNSAKASVITSDVLTLSSGLEGTLDSSAPVGNGAWSATTFGGPAGAKSFQWLYWNDNGSEFTIGDLISLSFETQKPVDSPNNDFYISIYTVADGVSDGSSWYGQRLQFDPLYASSINGPADVWNTWATNGTVNTLSVYDHGIAGGYSAPSLSQLLDDNYNDDDLYSFSNVNYNNEKVRGISISTGSAWGNTFEGSIDNININFGNAGALNFDLEPASVPEPSSFAILLVGIAGLFSRRFSK